MNKSTFAIGSPSGKCAKLHTVATSNSRDHMQWSLYYCLFVRHILYMDVILRAHPIHGESHIQHNANGEVATLPKLNFTCFISIMAS